MLCVPFPNAIGATQMNSQFYMVLLIKQNDVRGGGGLTNTGHTWGYGHGSAVSTQCVYDSAACEQIQST